MPGIGARAEGACTTVPLRVRFIIPAAWLGRFANGFPRVTILPLLIRVRRAVPTEDPATEFKLVPSEALMLSLRERRVTTTGIFEVDMAPIDLIGREGARVVEMDTTVPLRLRRNEGVGATGSLLPARAETEMSPGTTVPLLVLLGSNAGAADTTVESAEVPGMMVPLLVRLAAEATGAARQGASWSSIDAIGSVVSRERVREGRGTDCNFMSWQIRS